MPLVLNLPVGLTGVAEMVVGEQHTAPRIGSGRIRVLATPVMIVRKIDTRDFRRATRTTSREINRRIVLNLVRDHQPLSRADLARHMEIGRGVVTAIVQELIGEGTHERVVVNLERFDKRIQGKARPA